MPIQQLRLYDLIVDILPGITAIFFLQQIFRAQLFDSTSSSSTGLRGAVVLIVAGFIVGRVVHSLSSSSSDILLNSVVKPIYGLGYLKFGNYVLAEFRKSIPVEEREWVVDLLIDESIDPEANPYMNYPRIYPEIVDKLPDLIQSKYNINFTNFAGEGVRHFGYSKLYGQESLYRRYNMLATFSRNMAFVFWFFAIATIIQGSMAYYNVVIFGIQSPWLQYSHAEIIPVVLLLLGIIFSRQLYLFSTRRNRHLAIDIYQSVSQEQGGPSEK